MKAGIILTIMLISLFLWRNSNRRTIRGTVYGKDDKKPVAGVLVMIEGANTTTVTDASGKYAIKVPKGKGKLVFSFLGYKTQVLNIGKSDHMVVWLKTIEKPELVNIVAGYHNFAREISGING